MPIAPSFSITQDDGFVIVKIRVPYVRISSAEMICEKHDFSFYCHPYLLKLSFPCPLDGDDEEKCKAVYDADEDNGTIRAFLPKLTRGEVFPDLDLTTLLLQRRVERDFGTLQSGIPPIIEVVSSSSGSCGPDDLMPVDTASLISAGSVIVGPPRYGFNRNYERLFLSFREELVEMVELGDPDAVQECDRRALRRAHEDSLFNPERYLADFFGAESDPIYAEAMAYEPVWSAQWTAWKSAEEDDEDATCDAAFAGFSEHEDAVLKSLPNKRQLLEGRGSQSERELLLGLMDILFAFCFEFRQTRGEFTVESAHNLTRLSALLSWLDAYKEDADCARSVVHNACRRGIVYPYMRSWKLCRKVLADVAKVLYLGKRCILKCLLNLHSLYSHTDSHYMLNKMYIDDYCVWLQAADNASLDDAADEFNQAKREMERSEHHGKKVAGFMLPELEAWAFNQEDGQAEIPAELRHPYLNGSAPSLEANFSNMLLSIAKPPIPPTADPAQKQQLVPLISVLSSTEA